MNFYAKAGIQICLIDFRLIYSLRNTKGIITERHKNVNRTNSMYLAVDLKEKSELMEVISKANRFEITDYGFRAVRKHHNHEKNEYIIPKEVLEADLFINIPKLKTHRKAGLTCAMKNLVGINGDKTCLAHHTRGDKKVEVTSLANLILRHYQEQDYGLSLKQIRNYNGRGDIDFFQKYMWQGKSMKEHTMTTRTSVFTEGGGWYGNDTIWRCVKDLNKILLYADANGRMHNESQLFCAFLWLAGNSF